MEVIAIVAIGNPNKDGKHPIGINGKMPWINKNDLKWFKETTMGHPVIMGRRTYEAIGHPLQGRTNIVITTHKPEGDIIVVDSLEMAIEYAKTKDNTIFIIGGATVYKEAFEKGIVDKVMFDWIDEDVPGADTFFPKTIIGDKQWKQEGGATEIEKGIAYAYTFVKNHGEKNDVDEQYLSLVNEIINIGEEKDTRAGKTKSLFGKQLRFNLKNGLPMLTTKKMFAKGVIHELLWFLSGSTNIKYLVDNGVHIWDDDAYRYYLTIVDKHNDATQSEPERTWFKRLALPKLSKEEFIEKVKEGVKQWVIIDKSAYIMSFQPNAFEYEYQFGDLGPVYGKQWTNWGGVNQVKQVIETLKTNPDDRRIMINSWNVDEINDMALPPCHYSCQFYTKKMTLEERVKWFEENVGPYEYGENYELLDEWGVPRRKLSCMWNQRSVDTLLGLPFNIVSYAILTHIIAKVCGMDVDELIFNGGDCHVYVNQIDIYTKEQKLRNPHRYALPKLMLPNEIEIDKLKYEDIKIEGYESYPSIKYPLSVGL